MGPNLLMAQMPSPAPPAPREQMPLPMVPTLHEIAKAPHEGKPAPKSAEGQWSTANPLRQDSAFHLPTEDPQSHSPDPLGLSLGHRHHV